MCASKTTGYQGFRPFSVQECPTLKPGDSHAQRASKFSKMAMHILMPPNTNRLGAHAFASVTNQAMAIVQPSDYRVPDKRGVNAGEKLPEQKKFIAQSIYNHDFTTGSTEVQQILATSLEAYEQAFLSIAEEQESLQDPSGRERIIGSHQVPAVVKLALCDAAVARIVDFFTGFFDHPRATEVGAHATIDRDRITWPVFELAITHVHGLITASQASNQSKGTKPGGLMKVAQVKVIPATTPASSHQVDFGCYGEAPSDRPYVRKRGMASTTNDINPGTTKETYHIPGYTGFLPRTTHNPDAVVQAEGETPRLPCPELRLYHSDNLPGYTGHKPVDCANFRGECRAGSDPKTTNGHVYRPHL